MSVEMLVSFILQQSEGESFEQLEARWNKICCTSNITEVCHTTSMGRYESQFRTKGQGALMLLQREGEVKIIKQ